MKKQFIKDVNCNNVFLAKEAEKYKLEAVVYSYEKDYNLSISDFKSEKTEEIFDSLKIWENFDTWLLININPINNRINKHLGLIKLLKKNGFKIAEESVFFESYIYSNEKIEMYGAIKFESKNISDIVRIASENNHSLIVITEKNQDLIINDVIERKWSYNFNVTPYDNIPEQMFQYCENNLFVIYNMLGKFDDIDIDLILIGNEKMLKLIDVSG
jgi:hypothetical protein